MKRNAFSLMVIFCVSLAVGADVPVVNDGQPHGDPPYLLEDGWKPLIKDGSLDGWLLRNPERGGWQTTKGVYWGGPQNPRVLKGLPVPGDRLINTFSKFEPTPSDIYTSEKFGDIELYVEFLCADKTNSGVYLQGLYEIQIWDSYGRDQENIQDVCGTIYDYAERVDQKFVGAVPPRTRAERPTGEWQSFHAWFQAPRFDENGKKIANAKFLRVLHNGVLIHQNVEREGPTRACMNIPEAEKNPLMLQGDHGPIAFRNICVKPLRKDNLVWNDPAIDVEELKEIREPDVIFVPTPHKVVDKMLDLAQPEKGDLIYDLGCGDGRILIAAAKKYGCRGVGYDIDPERVKEARENVIKNNVEHLVKIEQKDIFTLDLSKADIITLYLLPTLNVKLIPQLEKLNPGARIVSHDFDMRGVKPDKVVHVSLDDDKDDDEFTVYNSYNDHTVYLWTTPLKKEN